MRAKTFYAEAVGEDVGQVDVPVVGGHAGVTILPLFSQASPYKELSDEKTEALTRRTQDGGTEVVQAKAGKARAGSPTPCTPVVSEPGCPSPRTSMQDVGAGSFTQVRGTSFRRPCCQCAWPHPLFIAGALGVYRSSAQVSSASMSKAG